MNKLSLMYFQFKSMRNTRNTLTKIFLKNNELEKIFCET